MSEIEHLISLRNVGLTIPCFVQAEEGASGVGRSFLGGFYGKIRREHREILSGISFSVRDGDRLALLGRNGAGKTSLLHVLAGAYEPTQGQLQVRGDRQALLNISLGFHGDATVRENVLLRAAAIGMPLREVRRALPSILEFAELEAKANDRLHTLSAGQRLRLAFSVATAKQPDILLLDEWISAGDVNFLRKAQGRLKDIVSESRIVVLASHSTELLRSVCNRGLVLEGGKVHYFGDIAEAIGAYSDLMSPPRQSMAAPPKAEPVPIRELDPASGGMPNPGFAHHVLHENRRSEAGRLIEQKLMLEILAMPPHEAMIQAVARCLGEGGSVSSMSSEAGQIRCHLTLRDGAHVVMAFRRYDGTVSRKRPEGTGTCHLAWTAGGASGPSNPA